MSATDELSRMLDERGKEHRVWPSGLVIWHDEGSWVYEYNPPKGDDDYWGGILRATLRHCTPERAVAATLGAGTCHNAMPLLPGGMPYPDSWMCSECEGRMDGIILEIGNFCPNCGRKVVE